MHDESCGWREPRRGCHRHASTESNYRGGRRSDGGLYPSQGGEMSIDLRGKTAVVGVGQAGQGVAEGFSEMEILVQASQRAVADAGLTMQDIDGIATASVSASMWAMPVIEHLGIKPTFIESTMLGGSSFVAHLQAAAHALHSGQCNAVLVCYGSTQRSSTINRAEIASARKKLDPQPYEAPYNPLSPNSSYALAAARHMYEYGTPREQRAAEDTTVAMV